MFKKCISLCVSLVLMCFCVLSASAYVEPEGYGGTYNKEWDKSVKYWRQGKVPNDNSSISTNSSIAGCSIESSACSNFSMACCLVKMGLLNPSKETPVSLIRKADMGGSDKSFYFTGTNGSGVDRGYGFDFTRISELYPDVTYEGRDYGVSVGGSLNINSLEELKTFVKGQMNKGYFVIANMSASGLPTGGKYPSGSYTGGHFCFLDGFDDNGKLVMADSWTYGTTWDDSYDKGSWTIKSLVYFKLKGKKPADCKSVYDGGSSNDSSNSSKKSNLKMSKTEEESFSKMVDEWELDGMPSKTVLNVKTEPMVFKSNSDLTDAEKAVMADIQIDKESDKVSPTKLANGVISFVGLAIIIYAVILFGCFAIDTLSPFHEVSLVKVISLGHLHAIRSKDDYDMSSISDKEKKSRYVSNKKLICYILIIFVIGCMFISGFILKIISSIIGGVVN